MVLDFQRILTGIVILLTIILSYLFSLTIYLILSLFIISIFEIYKKKILSFDNFYFYFFFLLFNIIFYFSENKILILIFSQVLFLIISLRKEYIKTFFPLTLIVFFYSIFHSSSINDNFIYIIIALSFVNDSLAYVSGKFFKGPLIIPSISPRKTWSGTIISCLITQFIIYITLNFNILYSFMVSISFFIGDLYFSFIKRSIKIKDFSKILPGHGGVLDRLDSIFLGFLIFILIYHYG